MLTREENALLTGVGPGTPMGNLLRRYWHPIGTTADLQKDPVQPVRLLGEDLTLFRVPLPPSLTLPRPLTAVRYGLVADRCAHRGLSLAYGIPQENGLRCAYHGWTYDPDGRVADMPFEPACLPLKVPAYPVQELCAIVWAYLGPRPAPLLPRWDVLVRNDLEKEIGISPLPCNWLQCVENGFDPIHFEHLHGHYGNYVMRKLGRPRMLNPARHLKIEFDLFEYGIYKRRLCEGESDDCTDWTVGHPMIFPNILAQGGPDEMSLTYRVPTDDTHTVRLAIRGWRPRNGQAPSGSIPVNHEPLTYDERGQILADHIVMQDMLSWVGQGPIADRPREHLVTSDRGIQLFRTLLLENLARVERGEDPMAVIRDPAVNEPMIEIARGTRYGAFRAGVGAGYGGAKTWGMLS